MHMGPGLLIMNSSLPRQDTTPDHLEPARVFKYLGEETRLRMLMLLDAEGELCVCEIAFALELPQPRTSQHLAQLRSSGLLSDARQGQWIFYRLHPGLPDWVRDVLRLAAGAWAQPMSRDQLRLQQMGERPQRQRLCR